MDWRLAPGAGLGRVGEHAGEFSGGGTGSSLHFQDHRAYSPGDDPRHINWQAYARTGHYSMKLYREEVRPVVDLILDGSESMFFEPAGNRYELHVISRATVVAIPSRFARAFPHS